VGDDVGLIVRVRTGAGSSGCSPQAGRVGPGSQGLSYCPGQEQGSLWGTRAEPDPGVRHLPGARPRLGRDVGP